MSVPANAHPSPITAVPPPITLAAASDTPPRIYAVLAVGIAVLSVGARAWMAWTTHSTAEDFLITLRYAENIANGQGFAYNPGERVLGTTTPLYTLFLALCAWLRLDAANCGKAVNILADGLTCWLLIRLPARPIINLPVAGLFAGLLYALGSTPINISIGGMETGLVTCAGLAAVTAFLNGNARALCVLGAVLFLLRVDTLLLFACLLAAHCLTSRCIPWRDLGLALLLVLPWLAFALAYFGSIVPTSLVAKVIVYAHPQMSSREAVVGPFRQQFLSGVLQCGLTLLACVGAARVCKHREWRLLAPLLWLLCYYGIMLASRVPAFAWYFLPPWPLFLLLASLGAVRREGETGRREEEEREGRNTEAPDRALKTPVSVACGQTSYGRKTLWFINSRLEDAWGNAIETGTFSARQGIWTLALAFLGLLGLVHLRSVRADIQHAQALEDTVRHPLGLWLRGQVKANERVLLEPIGTIGYYSRARMLDMIGLTSPEVFASYRTPFPLTDITRRLHPEWLCLRPNEIARLMQGDASLLRDNYRQIREVRAPEGGLVFVLYHRRQEFTPPVAQ